MYNIWPGAEQSSAHNLPVINLSRCCMLTDKKQKANGGNEQQDLECLHVAASG